jgi:hypothetical protein
MSCSRLLIPFSLSILLCGCVGVTDNITQPSQSCVGEPTEPITASELARSLKRHEFSVHPILGDAICDGPVSDRMPVSLGNVHFEGPHENIDRHAEITRREGHVFCGLRRGPIWGWRLDEDLNAPPASPIFSGDKATFSFANLECTLYPEGARRQEQVRNLQRAVRELSALARRKRAP